VRAKHRLGPHVRQSTQLVQHKLLERFVRHEAKDLTQSREGAKPQRTVVSEKLPYR
jgi:hypothetical protein